VNRFKPGSIFPHGTNILEAGSKYTLSLSLLLQYIGK
jgi:hypothetical protein